MLPAPELQCGRVHRSPREWGGVTIVIWIIGLAGAGKTTVGRLLVDRLRSEGVDAVHLDGDDLREIMGGDLGHSLDDRRANGWRMCRLGRYLEGQGVPVVCSILSLFAEHQAWNRSTLEDYFEVFLDVPMDVLEARDQKGLYTAARRGERTEVAGLDLPFDPPAAPDLVIDYAAERLSADESADRIITQWRGRRPGMA